MPSDEPKFPRHLLDSPIEERIAYFASKVINHDHLVAAYEAIRAAIEYPGGLRLVFLYGPTGIGKTTLLYRIQRDVTKYLEDALAQDPGRYAILTHSFHAIENKSIKWRDFYTSMLRVLHEPAVDKKVNYEDARFEQGRLSFTSKDTTAKYRFALAQALRQRRLAAVILDDAHVLANMGNSKHLLEQMEVLRSLADESETLFVLFGAYPILTLMELSGQISRRSLPIHFSRYRYNVPAEREIFANVIYSFQQYLPLRKEPRFTNQVDYFYERSLGCVGVLKQWLDRAYALALKAGETTLPQRYLDVCAPNDVRLSAMLEEIRRGEEKLDDPEARRERLAYLGMSSSGTTPLQTPSAEKSPTKQKGGRRVARNPTRDPVGRPPQKQKNG